MEAGSGLLVALVFHLHGARSRVAAHRPGRVVHAPWHERHSPRSLGDHRIPNGNAFGSDRRSRFWIRPDNDTTTMWLHPAGIRQRVRVGPWRQLTTGAPPPDTVQTNHYALLHTRHHRDARSEMEIHSEMQSYSLFHIRGSFIIFRDRGSFAVTLTG